MSRAPKPIAVLKLEKGKLYDIQRDRAAMEPQSQSNSTPRCPRDFRPAERKAWRAYAAVLKDYGLFQGGNAGLLRRLATATVLYEKLRSEFLETDLPKVGMTMMRVGRDMDAMEEKIGLPSVSRARLGGLALRAKRDKDKFFDD